MMNCNTYFSNVPEYGNMNIDYVIFEDNNIPILFTLKNETNSMFLAVCCDFRSEQRWIITKTTSNEIISLLKNELFLFDAFRNDKSKRIIATWKNGYELIKYRICDFSEIDKDDLPTENTTLEADEYEFDEYINSLYWNQPFESCIIIKQKSSVIDERKYYKEIYTNEEKFELTNQKLLPMKISALVN